MQETEAGRRHLLRLAVFFFLYIFTAWAGSLFYFPNHVLLFWPPAGVGLAAMVLYGYGMWPIVAFGQFFYDVLYGAPFSLTIVVTTASVAQAAFGTYLLKRLRFAPLFADVRDTLAFLAAAALSSVIVPLSATLVFLLMHTAATQMGGLFDMFTPRWLGHTLSTIVLGAFIIRWTRRPYPRTWLEFLEAFAAGILLILVDLLVFLTPYNSVFGVSLIYLVLFPFLWISIRIGPRGMTLGLLVTTVIGLTGAMLGASTVPSAVALTSFINTEVLLLALAMLFLIFVSSQESRKDALTAAQGYTTQLEDAVNQLNLADRTKTEFIAILAHELRNPLAAIRTSAEIVSLELAGDERVKHTMAIVDERVQTMVRLLDDLLDISRVSQKKLLLQKEVVDMRLVVERALESAKPLISNRGHRIELKLAPALFLQGDPVRLEQIVINLVTNAVKYTSAGGRIIVSCRKEDGHIVLTVADNGIGIPSDMLSRIFEPFVQINESNYGNSGLGVGLSLTKQLVEMHGGTIEAASSGRSQGSTFIVRLPAAQGMQGSQVIRNVPGRFITAQPERDKNIKILIVDDNQVAAQGLRELLRLRGYTADIAYTGEQALDMAPRTNPDVIILDIGLPGMDGYDVARILKQNAEFRGSIVALTGYGAENDKARAVQAGFDRHLVKPVGLAEIEMVLNEILSVKSY